MTHPPLQLRWSRREPPLPVAAVAGSGTVAVRLRSGGYQRSQAGARLSATGNADWIVLLGAADDLPWADGATFLGWDSDLLVPTTRAPWPPADLVRASLRRRFGPALAILLPERLLVSPNPARRLDPRRLVP